MTRMANARLAGLTFLLYIAVGVGQMFVGRGATTGDGAGAKLASIATHALQLRVNLVLSLFVCVTALTLAVALYGVTRDEDHEVALLALVCRCLEGGVAPMISIVATLGLLWLATSTEAGTLDARAIHPLAAFLLKVRGWIPLVAAIFFSVGSLLFSWLLLRGRMIPALLAWLGIAASVLLVVALPLQLVEVLHGPVTQLMWIPMAAFEVPLGIWLLVKGVPERATPANPRADRRR
jgi:hypothetical protein